MTIHIEHSRDPETIYSVMMKAFWEYQQADPPSSALAETVELVAEDLQTNGQALLMWEYSKPVAMVRFTLEGKTLTFYRLSVIPEKQGQGMAKQLLQALEQIAREQGVETIYCKVRAAVKKNLQLYQSVGFEIYEESIVINRNNQPVQIVAMKRVLERGDIHGRRANTSYSGR
ncbi:hypothetical protein JCM19046_141 [Bacillus sp. JCM 19046]|uniref:Ribosomal protein S18 acetylase RimI-like enzyme n=1 Tax=Shouchella xiaoxiensis TaxID=766895 RepID=A0ABS2SUN8_9BACI|nr:ribosomal protein S18 acetylase RimI-like enzyme [Shouchella xiaoxiensis]GAF15104.1 hypothetical protein JCM19045_4449 [Bacillus sp. JCM 19045]GAF15745.1 hypothetical protein JCM19046_141 [Bacillus sp. JCM 19046]